jgi:hypothetical protein
MHSANKTLILATADGILTISYANATVPQLLITVPSNIANPTTGVEIMENFAFDPTLPVGPMIITGGGYRNPSAPLMVLVDENTGKSYSPDTATSALFVKGDYIDSAVVDTTYHVVVLADEGTGTTFVNLANVILHPLTGKYTLLASDINRITTYSKMDNLGLDSTNHLLMMGAGFGGNSTVVAKLSNPATTLGFAQEVLLNMPTGNDNVGNYVYWSGGLDPHTAGAYLDASLGSRGVWLSSGGTHTALIDLQKVLTGALANPATYAPLSTGDIKYIKMP